MRYRLDNGIEISIYPSRVNEGDWNYNVLLHGRMIGGGVGFASMGDAYDAAMAAAE